MPHLEIQPISGALGAEISGVDLSKDLSNETFNAIHQAFLDHQVIFFRDQKITHEQHKAFGRRFGSLNIHPYVKGMAGHPETGRKALYVNPAFTEKFVGMTRRKSLRLLKFLFDHCTQEGFTCRLRWTADAIAFWDNHCVQHFALNDYQGHRRHMERVTINGDKPF